MRSLSLSCCFCDSGWEVGERFPVFSRFIDNIKILVPNVVRGVGVVICVFFHSCGANRGDDRGNLRLIQHH
jgi:hypothetical protein